MGRNIFGRLEEHLTELVANPAYEDLTNAADAHVTLGHTDQMTFLY